MKLIIQIPCFNEEATLPTVLAELPRHIAGVEVIEYMVIDDGSTDRTSDLAHEHGAHHLVRFAGNRGLARAFMAGIDAGIRLGADIIVNTDADNQYASACIEDLVRPIIDGQADIVVGDRQVGTVASFSTTKKRLQRFGTWVVRQASGSSVSDATSGFRALSREAALALFVTSEFTYTLETIIQAGTSRLKIASVPIRTNAPTRPSRLFSSIGGYIKRSMGTIVRIYTMYNPLKSFLRLAAVLFAAGLAAGIRFLYFLVTQPDPVGHTQSLILAAILILAAFQVALSGVVADLVGANRKLLESVLTRVRRLEADLSTSLPASAAVAQDAPDKERE